MWLLDANMDVHLAPLLTELGVPCEATTRRGWQALTNGDLVSHAVRAGFDCLLTQDRAFAEAASRALRVHSGFAVVVVHLPQCRWQVYREAFLEAWHVAPIVAAAGRVVHWPDPGPDR